MVPANTGPSILEIDGHQGWGIHAVQGYSLMKFLNWMMVLTVLGMVFLVVWLVKVDEKDLVNALAPLMFFYTTVLVVLGIPQVLGVA